MSKTFIISEKQALRAISVCTESGWRTAGRVVVGGVVSAITLQRGTDMLQIFPDQKRIVIHGPKADVSYARSGKTLFMKDKGKGYQSWTAFLKWCER